MKHQIHQICMNNTKVSRQSTKRESIKKPSANNDNIHYCDSENFEMREDHPEIFGVNQLNLKEASIIGKKYTEILYKRKIGSKPKNIYNMNDNNDTKKREDQSLLHNIPNNSNV